MTIETKVRKIGNSLGIILPKEVLQEMNAAEGTVLYLTEGGENSVRVSNLDPSFAEKSALVDEIIRQYPNALRELAK